MSVCICMYTYILHTFIYVCTFICMYIYAHTRFGPQVLFVLRKPLTTELQPRPSILAFVVCLVLMREDPFAPSGLRVEENAQTCKEEKLFSLLQNYLVSPIGEKWNYWEIFLACWL